MLALNIKYNKKIIQAGEADKKTYLYEINKLTKKLKIPKVNRDLSLEELSILYGNLFKKAEALDKKEKAEKLTEEERMLLIKRGGTNLLEKLDKKKAKEMAAQLKKEPNKITLIKKDKKC